MKKDLYIAIISLALYPFATNSSPEIWRDMQHLYGKLSTFIASYTSISSIDDYCHPHWKELRKHLSTLIMGPYNPRFLNDRYISGSMVRSGMNIPQQYELCMLQECLSPTTKQLISTYQDVSFSNIPRECTAFNCSTNTLGHLYYAARTIDLMDRDPQTIVEFGPGYGNLARIYINFFPHCRYIMVDLPELLALQYFFLKETVPNKKIIFHVNPPEFYQEDAIHLIAINYLNTMEIDVDLFISTFALSETSNKAQDLIHDKKFLNARMVYLSGQINGWGKNFNFADHDKIHTSLRSLYKYVDCHPFHFLLNGLSSYEVIAKNPL